MNDFTHSKDQTELRKSDAFVLFLSVLWKNKKLLLINFFTASVFFVAIALVMPKTYLAETTLMPPSSDSNIGMLGAALASSPLSAFMGTGSNSEAMSAVAILKSRTLAEQAVDTFNLMAYYDVEKLEDALRIFSESNVVNISEEGTIKIDFYLSTAWFSSSEEDAITKKLVSDISNFMAYELDILNKRLKTEQARSNRIFIEERYQQNIEDLKKAEVAMQDFQEKNNIVALPEQTNATISAAATIQAQIISDDVKIQTLLNSFKVEYPQVQSLKKEIETLNEKLVDLEKGQNISEMFPGFKSIPDLGIKYGRLLREIEIQNKIFTFLTQQYEEAKITEAKDTPTVQVLDSARPPEKKARPRRSLFVLFWVAIIMLGSAFSVVYKPVIKQIAADITKK